MRLKDALAAAAALGIARLDAQLLLLHALGRPGTARAWLIAHDDDPLPAALQAHFLALCERRAAGEPVAYLTGEKEFFGLPLQVDARVLVPRPDTETLVEWSLELLRDRPAPASSTWAPAAAPSRWPSSPPAAMPGWKPWTPVRRRWKSRRRMPCGWACRWPCAKRSGWRVPAATT